MLVRALLLTLIFLSFYTLTFAQKAGQQKAKQRVQVTGIFSDLRYSNESGDVIGLEIFIVYAGDYYATIQVAEGFPEPPFVVKLQVKDSSIEFTLPEKTGSLSGLGKFTGKITATGLNGKFEHETEKRALKRKNSYWQ